MTLEESIRILEVRCAKIDERNNLKEFNLEALEAIIKECTSILRGIKIHNKDTKNADDDYKQYYNALAARVLSIRSRAKQKKNKISPVISKSL